MHLDDKKTGGASDQTIEQIGTVLVDSGQLLLVDPCYLGDWVDGDCEPNSKRPLNNYDECCRAVDNDRRAGQVLRSRAMDFLTAYGDGEYPVYAIRNSHGAIIMALVDLR